MDAEANDRISYEITQSFSRKSLKFIVRLQKCAGNDHKEPQPLKTLTWTEVELCSWKQGRKEVGSEKSGKDLERILIYININVFLLNRRDSRKSWCMKQHLKGATETMSIAALVIFIPALYSGTVISNSCLDGGRGGCGWRSLAGRKTPRSLHKAPFKSWVHWLKESFWWHYIDTKLVDVWTEYDKNPLCFQAIRF